MKPNIQRDIKPRHEKPEGPRIGQVPHMRGPADPNSGRWVRRRSSERTAGPRPVGPSLALRMWSLVFVVATIMVIVGFSLFWMRSHRTEGRGNATGNREDVRIFSRFATPSEDETLALVRKALANRDLAKVEDLVRPGSSTPAEVVAFMKHLKQRDGPLQRMVWLGSLDVGGMFADGVLVVSGEAKPVERLAILLPDDQGVWKMDFGRLRQGKQSIVGEIPEGFGGEGPGAGDGGRGLVLQRPVHRRKPLVML